VINENQRLDYLNQLGVVSWMPRQPLSGAKPSEIFYHEAPKKASPLSLLRPRTDGETEGSTPKKPVSSSTTESVAAVTEPASVLSRASNNPPHIKTSTKSDTTGAAMDALAAKGRVNRVPEHLQLAFIRQQGNRPLIVSHFGDRGDSEYSFVPLSQSMLQFMGFNEPLVSLPFVWPLAGMPPVCREQEFVQVFRALLGGARLGCQANQECWWFGDLPELIAESDNLLNITLHHPCSLTGVMASGKEKQAVLYQLLALKNKAQPE